MTHESSQRSKEIHNGAKYFLEENSNFFKRFLVMLQNKRNIPIASQFNELLVENISQAATRKTPASPSSFSLCPLQFYFLEPTRKKFF
jgi:hypothetical protein